MTEADRANAERRLAVARRVGELIAKLEEVLDGRSTRAQVMHWARDPQRAWPEYRLPGSASAVANALCNLDARGFDGREFVGEHELRVYLDTLRRGESFVGTGEPFVGLALDIDSFAARLDLRPVHWLDDGVDWSVELQFGVPTSGRAFLAACDARARTPVEIRRQRHVGWRDALTDLFEGLALDEHEVTWWHPEIELVRLPRWALWREDDNANQFELERSYSFAKLELRERTMRERGHRQFYWIDPVG
jgi:hypothetical protein